MSLRLMKIALASCALALLAGCGLPGAPMPPSLELPRPVTDLRAVRSGNKVTLTWTPPRETTDHAGIRRIGATRVCRSIGPIARPADAPKGCVTFLGAINVPASKREEAHPTPASYVDTLPADFQAQHPLDVAVYTIDVLNDHGRNAGPSNTAVAPLAPTLAAPTDLRAELTRDYVQLSWTAAPETAMPASGRNPAFGYRVYREQPDTKRPLTTVDLWGTKGVRQFDRNFDWNTRYVYRVASITSVPRDGGEPVIVEGEKSAPVELVTKDVFPPAVPSGLQAVFTEAGAERYIDLTWLPSTSADIAGYNVYRWEEGGQPAKINTELLKTPTTRDAKVAAGRRYYYAVTAVDIRGNESERSQPANEQVPR